MLIYPRLEKLGPKYRIALRIARDERWERLRCDHKGVYADGLYLRTLPCLATLLMVITDCIVDRCMKSKIYIV